MLGDIKDKIPTNNIIILVRKQLMTMKQRNLFGKLGELMNTDPKKKKPMPKQQLGTIDRANKSYSFYFPQSNKSIESPQTPKKQEAPFLISDTKKILSYYYDDNLPTFFEPASKYLNLGWQSYRKKINEHLNKLLYLEKSMYKNNYTEIEEQIVKEWRKNHLLYTLRSFWYEAISTHKFNSLGEFLQEYRRQSEFIGQLAHLYFKGFFAVLSPKIKTDDSVLERLIARTSHFILTQTNTWGKVYNKVIQKMIIKKLNIQPHQEVSKIDFDSLNISPYALNLKEKMIQMPKTADAIAKFNFENKILSKIKLLSKVRHSMEEEIKDWQQQLIKQGVIKEYKILDKDDFIGCLVYAVVRGEIPLEELGASVKMFRYLLEEEECSNILSKWGCDSYLADLESVFDFLVSWSPEEKVLNSSGVAI